MLYDNNLNSKDLFYDDICEKEKIYADIAFNNEATLMEVNETTGTVIPRPIDIRKNRDIYVANDPEIMIPFLKIHNIVPNWINCNRVWGTLNMTTGQWNGCVGKVK